MIKQRTFARPLYASLLSLLLVFNAIGCVTQPVQPAAEPTRVQPVAGVTLAAEPEQEAPTPVSAAEVTSITGPEREAATPVPVTPAPLADAARPKTLQKLQIGAVGDVMLGTDFPANRLADDDGATLLAQVVPILRQPDVTFINLEATLMDGGEPRKQCADPKTCYLFRTPQRYVKYLVEAGVDVVSLANNHARDFGETGRSNTMRVLADAGIRHSGRDGDVASWEVKGLRVALIAYSPFVNSHDFLDIPQAQEQVRKLAVDHDIVIVSMHAGAEGEEYNHITFAPEVFLGENRGDLFAFSHAVIDAGADLVIGHGPHVVRALELYKDRLIAYSLGNFATYFGISVTGKKGYAPVLLVDVDGEGRFMEGRIVSTIQRRPGGPAIDYEHRAAREMADLTRADFPDTPLRIGPFGSIMRLENAQTVAASSR